MGFAETMIFYHLIGAGVATAVFLSDPAQSRWSRVYRVATAVIFWPLYLPILLSRPKVAPMPKIVPADAGGDAMVEAIAQVEAELETALTSLDGWAEGVLAHETDRFRELGTAWRPRRDGSVRSTACSPGQTRRASTRGPPPRDRRRASVVARASKPARRTSRGSVRSAIAPTKTSWAPWRGSASWCR